MKTWTLVLIASFGAFAQSGGMSWNFDSDTASQIARGFTNEVGEWKVEADNTAPSRPNVLAQRARSSGPTFNMTLIGSTSYKDVDISVSMKAGAGSIDQGGGLVWRARDARNYYVARYNPLEDNYRVYKVENGVRSAEFQNANAPASPGWHTLRATMTGDRIECYYDGKKYLDVRDATFKDAGRIGLWTKADAQTRFDDLTVTSK